MGSRSKTKAQIANDNRIEGSAFEKLFLKRAQLSGLLAIKNHLQAKMTYGGRYQVLKSDLDYKLITQEGRIGFFDCKNFASDSFPRSQISDNQVERAILYNEWKVPAGFIVFFRAAKSVCFFSGMDLEGKEGGRLSYLDGFLLGTWDSFDLKLLFTDTCQRGALGKIFR